MTFEKFYMVKREGNNVASFIHADQTSAHGEAARLARKEIGVRFYVMESIEMVFAQEPVITTVTNRPTIKKKGVKR